MQVQQTGIRGFNTMTAILPAQRHTPFEDAHALLMGSLFIGFGFALLQSAELITGGAAGIALILHYATGLPVGALFFAINIPFYLFAVRAMGWAFTLKTLATNVLLALWSWIFPRVLDIAAVEPAFAALAGGTLMGMGVLALARHKASVGGIGVLAIYLQEKRGWRAGKVQMGIDSLIVAAALFVLDPLHLLLSVASVVALSLVLVINHKPGRYAGY